MKEIIEKLKAHNLLKVIDEPLDIYLEIPHVAYIEVKKPNSKAILFTKPIDKKTGKNFDIPVLMNIFCSYEAVKLFIGDVEKIGKEIENLMHLKLPSNFMDKISMFGTLFNLKNVFPKRSTKKGICQEIIKKNSDINLFDLPILTTWEGDGGPFITMGQVYTTSLDGIKHNLGMYRLQVFDEKTLGLHWQIHKDGNHFFHEYKKAGKPMPVSIAIGGDPLYIWCGQAPLPIGVFELMLYGFIKNTPAQLVKCLTNDLYVPHDVDFVIEGFVDTGAPLIIEGPFGDHTGYYTLKEPYPALQVTAITSRKNPTYLATVVGKPPLEDKYMGYATERIFLPLLKATAPDLIDYYMPENGVFHNFIVAKIKPLYPAHANQIMHAFWGVGQMSFVKHAIFVDDNAPELTDYDAISNYILNRVSIENVFISRGVVDALDHSSPKPNMGGKLGLDCTGDEIENIGIDLLDDEILLVRMKRIDQNIISLKQWYCDTKNPICVVAVNKCQNQKNMFEKIKELFSHIKILIIIDASKNDVSNGYMLLWRIVNNIDSNRDVVFYSNTICVDATDKNELDNFMREWPDDVECNKEVLKSLQERNIIEIDDEFFKKFYI